MAKAFLIIAIMIFLAAGAQAATITGQVYNPDFRAAENVLVKVSSDSGLVNSVVSKDGSYIFELNPGSYVLEAEIFQDGILILSSSEKIDVSDENIIIDIVVLPDSEEIPEDFSLDDFKIEDRNSNWIALIVLLAALAAIYFYKKRSKKAGKDEELPKDLKNIMNIIKKQGGRINQVNLRKELPYSEAKVSLMVNDLEARGLIKRIKKGRGNVLIMA